MRTNLNQEATELFAREIIFRAIFSGGGVSAIPASETAMEIWLRVWLAFPDLRLVPFFFTATGCVCQFRGFSYTTVIQEFIHSLSFVARTCQVYLSSVDTNKKERGTVVLTISLTMPSALEQAEKLIPAEVRMISGCKDSQTSADVSNVARYVSICSRPLHLGTFCSPINLIYSP